MSSPLLSKMAIRVSDFFRWWEFNKKFLRWEDPWRYRSTQHEKNRRDAMERVIQGKFYDQALEIGCYEGLFSERLLPLSGTLTCLDISQVALRRCRRHLEPLVAAERFSTQGKRRPGLRFVRANFRTWDPGSQQFDLIVLGDVFYYLEAAIKLEKPCGEMIHASLPAAARRVCQWLRPRGRVLMTHGFGCAEQFARREGYRNMFVAEGLKILHEEIGESSDKGGSRVFLHLFEKPDL